MHPKEIESVCIVGAGFMGAQIGLQCALHGLPVRLTDVSPAALAQVSQAQSAILAQRIEEGELTPAARAAALARIHTTADLSKAVDGVDLVIEAVPERLDLKRQVFAQLDARCAPHTVLATNSSSLRISTIEDVTERPDRVLNLHFYAPVWQRHMVDLQRGTGTSEETFERARRFARRIGCTPLLVLQESTGFVFNRVWRAVKRECLHLVQDGVASYEDVDRAWMIFNDAPVGPFGLMDMIGLDVIADIERVYYSESGDARDVPPPLLTERVERGELGVKTGVGFYRYPNPAYEDPAWLHGDDAPDL
jgi:3-hydroxybutyryl-CoA dehydrogenase